MTDNEIIKALECCIKDNCDCGECPAIGVCQHDPDCPKTIALDLINRQKAEIEDKTEKLRKVLPIVAELKAEAIKEFAERLKDYYIKDKRYDRPNAHTMICFLFDRIDNLAKEMGCAYTGEQVLQSYCHQKCEDYSPLPKKRKDDAE